MEEELLDNINVGNEGEFHGKKFNSNRTILIATFFGGPVAAGFLIRENFKVLKKEKEGNIGFLLGVVSTILLFGGLFIIPENILDKIPNMIIPIAYMGVIYLIVEKTQGKVLKQHEDSNGAFYTGWRSAGIGLLSGVVLMGSIVGVSFYGIGSWDVDTYNAGLEKFNQNEVKAMEMFELLETKTPQETASFIEDVGIPKWEENIKLIESMDAIVDLPQEFLQQNELLHEYSEIRIKSFNLIEEAILNETSDYDEEIFDLNERIDKIIESL